MGNPGGQTEVLPSSIDAEKVVLGAILLDNETFYDSAADLKVDDFYLASHRTIFAVMSEILFGMVEGVSTADIVTIPNELNKRRLVSAVGGVSYIASLTEGMPRRPVITNYIAIIKEKAKLRAMTEILSAGLSRAADQSESYDQISSEIQGSLSEVSAESQSHTFTLGEITPDVTEDVRKSSSLTQDREALEYTWGIPGMDSATHGLFRGEFTVLSGESGGGKTICALQTVLCNAEEGTPCAIFSIEMTKEKLVRRLYPMMSEIITSSMTRDPRLMSREVRNEEMNAVSQRLNKLPIYIDDTSPIRIDTLCARVKMLRRKFGVKIFVVDYLQLIEGMPGVNEAQAFKKIVFMLRDLPKSEPDIHLLVLSQYSKADGFTKKTKRGKDSLYGGSVIHHAAQNVVMIDMEDSEKRDKNDLLDTVFKIAKQREGGKTKVNSLYDRDHLKFVTAKPLLGGI